MATIQARKDKAGRLRYRAQVRVRGAQPISETFGTRKTAREWADKTESAIRSGLWIPPAPGTLHTLSEAITRFVTDKLPMKRPNTQASYGLHLDWWRDRIGHLALADVVPSIVCECRDALREGRAPASVNRFLATLSVVLGVAMREWQWSTSNSCLSVSRLREPRGRVRYLADDERARLLAECKAGQSAALHPVTLLALTTGARRSEILGLRWKDINLAAGVVVYRDTKNGDNRSAPVEGLALEVLREWGKVRPFNTNAFVFPSRNGQRPANLRDGFERAVERAGIVDFTFHDLRHDCASRLAMQGHRMHEIAALLGHRGTQMTARYVHLSPAHMRKVAATAAL